MQLKKELLAMVCCKNLEFNMFNATKYVGCLLIMSGLFDIASHKIFKVCINPINIISAKIFDKNPNTYGNSVVGD